MTGPLRLTQAYPRTGDSYDVATDAGRAWLASVYAPEAAVRVRLNMITTLTGSAVGSDGTSETLSSRTDRAILKEIRASADAVVVGAASVRAEGYVVPRIARLVIMTTSGDLTGMKHPGDPSRVLLVCPRRSVDTVRERAALPNVDILGVGDSPTLEPREVIDALAAHDLVHLVCEGGPGVASLFARADLIDEYCVTIAPTLGPAAHPFLALHTQIDTDVAGMLVDDASFSYLRLRPRRRVPARAATP